MKRPNVDDYDLKPYSYIADLTKYIEHLESEVKKLNALAVSNWGDLQKQCTFSVRHSNFRACTHKDTGSAMICFSPARCPMIKKWSTCNKNSPFC